MPEFVANYTPAPEVLRAAVTGAKALLPACVTYENRPATHDAVDFLSGYLQAAEWLYSGGKNGDKPIPRACTGFAASAVTQAAQACVKFMSTNAADLNSYCTLYGQTMKQAGIAFWLTHNGHSAGFRDRGSADCPHIIKMTYNARYLSVRDIYYDKAYKTLGFE